MDTAEYQAKLNAIGIDRGKLASGFVDHEPDPPPAEKPNDSAGAHPAADENAQKAQCSPRAAPPAVETKRDPSPAPGKPVTAPVPKPANPPPAVNKPVRKCLRCGVTISMASKRCRSCVREDRRAKQVEMERKRAAQPSPPVPPDPPAEEEPPREVPYRLFLDAVGKRMVVVIAPSVISAKELKRIQGWIGLQLIIEDPIDWDYVI